MKESRKIKKSSGTAVLNLKELVGKMMFCMTLIMLTVMVVMAGVRECFANITPGSTKSEIAYGEYPKAGYTSYGSGYVKAKGNYEYLAGKEKAAFWWEMPDSYSIYDFDLVFQGTQKVKAGCETYDVWGLTKNKLEGVLNSHGGGRTTSIAVNNEIKNTGKKTYKDTYIFNYTYNGYKIPVAATTLLPSRAKNIKVSNNNVTALTKYTVPLVAEVYCNWNETKDAAVKISNCEGENTKFRVREAKAQYENKNVKTVNKEGRTILYVYEIEEMPSMSKKMADQTRKKNKFTQTFYPTNYMPLGTVDRKTGKKFHTIKNCRITKKRLNADDIKFYVYKPGKYKLKCTEIIKASQSNLKHHYRTYYVYNGNTPIYTFSTKNDRIESITTYKTDTTKSEFSINLPNCSDSCEYTINYYYKLGANGKWSKQYSLSKNFNSNKPVTIKITDKSKLNIAKNSKYKGEYLYYKTKISGNKNNAELQSDMKVKLKGGGVTINVYYVERKAKVYYYYNGTENKAARETIYTHKTNKKISVENKYKSKGRQYSHKESKASNAKLINGEKYKFVLSNTTATIKIKYNMKYKVAHYYCDAAGKNPVKGLVEDKVTTNSNTVGYTKHIEYKGDNYVFYKSSAKKHCTKKNENFTLTNTGAIINVYYKVKQDKPMTYTVCYYYDGSEATNLRQTKTIQPGASHTVTVSNNDTYSGKKYLFKDSNASNCTKKGAYKFVVNKSGAKIKIYYVSSMNYKINYYYNGVYKFNKTGTVNATTKLKFTAPNESNHYSNKTYNFDKSVVVSNATKVSNYVFNVKSNNAVVAIYYTDTLKYTVKYYYNGVNKKNLTLSTPRNKPTVTLSQKNILTYKNVTYAYKKDVLTKAQKSSGWSKSSWKYKLTGNNAIIKIYLENDDVYKYKIRYFYDNVEDTSKAVTDIAKKNATIVAPEQIKNGYKRDSTKTPSMRFKIVRNNQEIKVYYKKLPKQNRFNVHLVPNSRS